MILISHRRNTGGGLAAVSPELGIEMDLRSYGKRLVVQHEPFADGEDFEDWLDGYRHRLLIANVKEEGLEAEVLRLLDARGISEFFFLDQSFPFLVRTVRSGERRCAVRVSEFEDPATALTLAGQAEWIWLDCFTSDWVAPRETGRLQAAGFRVCVVSPELHSPDRLGQVKDLRAALEAAGVRPDAVCTKVPEQWEE